MARIELAPQVADDLERIVDHIVAQETTDASARIEDIIKAIEVLEWNPLIGPVRGDTRELVIGRRAQGYVALYRYVPALDFIFVLAVRAQKEAGYKKP